MGRIRRLQEKGLSAKSSVVRETNCSLLVDWVSVWLVRCCIPRDQLIGPVWKLRQRRSHLSADSAPPFWRICPAYCWRRRRRKNTNQEKNVSRETPIIPSPRAKREGKLRGVGAGEREGGRMREQR